MNNKSILTELNQYIRIFRILGKDVETIKRMNETMNYSADLTVELSKQNTRRNLREPVIAGLNKLFINTYENMEKCLISSYAMDNPDLYEQINRILTQSRTKTSIDILLNYLVEELTEVEKQLMQYRKREEYVYSTA